MVATIDGLEERSRIVVDSKRLCEQSRQLHIDAQAHRSRSIQLATWFESLSMKATRPATGPPFRVVAIA